MLLLSVAAAPGSVPSWAWAQEEMLGSWSSVWVPLWGRLWYNCLETSYSYTGTVTSLAFYQSGREIWRLCFWNPLNVLVWIKSNFFLSLVLMAVAKWIKQIYYWHNCCTNAPNAEKLLLKLYFLIRSTCAFCWQNGSWGEERWSADLPRFDSLS